MLAGSQDATLEGDDLLPEFVARWLEWGAAGAAFLIETNENILRERYLEVDQTACIHGDPALLEEFLPHYAAWTTSIAADATARELQVIDAGGKNPNRAISSALGLPWTG
jgi:hypothetical protein